MGALAVIGVYGLPMASLGELNCMERVLPLPLPRRFVSGDAEPWAIKGGRPSVVGEARDIKESFLLSADPLAVWRSL